MLRTIVKSVAVIAGLVFLFFNPLMNDVGLWFFASIPVLLVCFVLLEYLQEDEHEASVASDQ